MELNHSILVKWPWHFLPMTHCAESKRERACLHGGGGPQVGEAKYGGSPHLSCKRDQIKMRDYMDKRFTPPKRVTSPTWGPPAPCKQAQRKKKKHAYVNSIMIMEIKLASANLP